VDARRFSPAAAAIALVAWILLAGQLASAQNVYVEPFETLLRSSYVVPAGKFQADRVALVSVGDFVVQARVDAGLETQFSMWLTDATNLERLKSGQKFSAFPGKTGHLENPAFVQIPRYEFLNLAPGEYFLIVDNRAGTLFSQKISVLGYSVPQGPTEASRTMESFLRRFYDRMKKNFIFRDFQIEMKRCGRVNAYSSPDMHLCLEMAQDTIGNKTPGVFNFILLHELSHSLLNLWGNPAHRSEDIADEMATALLIIGGRPQDGREAAQWWRKQDTISAALQRPLFGDPHSPPGRRANSIEKWLDGGNEFARKWHRFLIPHVTTEGLMAVAENPKPWADMEGVRAEISRRKVRF
jgi:hypothetical protein